MPVIQDHPGKGGAPRPDSGQEAELAAAAAQAPQLPAPIQVLIPPVDVTIAHQGNGNRLMFVLHPSGWQFTIPLTEDQALQVADGLRGSGLVVPSAGEAAAVVASAKSGGG